jgi:hypothetical protein
VLGLLKNKEKECIVAFIDILGFSEMMRSDDAVFRLKVIGLLEKLSESYSSSHKLEVKDCGEKKVQIRFHPELSTFSDNVVISIPLTTKHGNCYPELNKFVGTLFRRIISIIWDGLHLGVIFRGAITKGRMYHNKNVVAGEGLVCAVEMEKKTKLPRIEIHEDVINCVDANGNKIIDKNLYDCAVKKVGEEFYLNSYRYHKMVWANFFEVNENDFIPYSNIMSVMDSQIEKIKLNIDKQIETLEGCTRAKEKWEWLKEEFCNEWE